MKRHLLLLLVVCNFSYSVSYSQSTSTSVVYPQQIANYNNIFYNNGGDFNVNGISTQIGLWAHPNSTGKVVIWRPFTTDGSTTSANKRSLQIGDQFLISASLTRAYGRIGLALLSSPSSESSWGDALNNSALSVNLDGPDYDIYYPYWGSWYLQYYGGSTSAASFGGNQGSYHDFTFTFTVTAPNRMNVTIKDITSSYTYTVNDILLNSSNPITDYSIYLQNDWDNTANQNVYFGLPASTGTSITNTGTIPIGASNASFTISGILADALYANQNSGSTYSNVLNKSGTGTVTLTGQNTYTGLTTVANGTLQLNHSGGTTIPVTGNVSVSSGGTLQISSNQTVNNLTLASGATLIVDNGVTLTINGTFQKNGGTVTNNGTISYGSSAILNYNAAQTTGAELTASLPNLTITAGSGNTVTLNSNVTITGTVNNTSGTLASGGHLTIAPGAAILTGYSNITGNVTLQQSIIGQRGWRAFANPFTSATSISTVASTNNITISTTASVASGWTDSETWDAPGGGNWDNVTGSSWAANTMYALFIRGLANEVSGTHYTAGPSPFTYSVSGTLNPNSVSFTPTTDEMVQFKMVGNPFAAPVKSSALTGQTTGTYYYIYQIPQGGSTAAKQTMAGSWVYATSDTSTTIPALGVVAYQPTNTNPFTVSTADIKTNGTPQTSLFGYNPAGGQLEIQVQQDSSVADKVLLQFDSTLTPAGASDKSLQKLYNFVTNLYTITANGTDMAIDTRNQLSVVPLGMYGTAGNYKFQVNTNSLRAGTTVYLVDSLLNTKTLLKQDSSYAFSITADTATYGEHRFSLVFNSKQVAIVSGDSSSIIWTGAVSTAWTDPGNWNLAEVPSLNSNVVIPSGPANNPILSGTATVATVSIGENEYLTVTGANTLTATGGITVQPNGGLIAAAANINATVTLQQAISANAGWRFINNPFAGSLNLQTVAANNANTFNPSNNVVWSTGQNNWVNNGTSIPANTPYGLYQNATANGYTLSETGSLNAAGVNYTPYISGTDTSWMFAGNPYASAVNSAALTGQTLGIPYYQWNVATQGWSVNLASDLNTAIPVLSSIAYWPWNNSSYTVTTADIHHFNNGGTLSSGVFGSQPTLQYLELEADRDLVYQDKLFLRTTSEAAPNGTALYNLRKMANAGFNLYSMGTDGRQLAVNAQPAWQDTLSIGMAGAAGTYHLKVNNNNLQSNTAEAYLLDGLTNTRAVLATGMDYSFELGSDSAQNRNRFKIVFSSNKQAATADSSNANLSVRVIGNVNTSGIYQVEISNAGAGQATMILYDLDGKVIGRGTAVNGMNEVKTGNKPAGMYVLEVSDGKSRVQAKLIKL